MIRLEFLPYPQVITDYFNRRVFGPPRCVTTASTCSWIDHHVSGLRYATFAIFRLAFASAPQLNCLTLLHHVTRRPILQKVRYRTEASLAVLYLLVNIRFQVLFHSPPGVLFTVPSQYYSLSVTRSYLGLGDGPPSFTPDFSCPVLLRIPVGFDIISVTRLLLCFAYLSRYLHLSCFFPLLWSLPQVDFSTWFGLLQFRSPLLSQSLFYFFFLQVLRCFSSLGSLRLAMYLLNDSIVLPILCFHIRISMDLADTCSSP